MDEGIPKSQWLTCELWRKQLERRLYELGALVKGNLPIQADRIADVVEQIETLRKELERVKKRQDKMAEWAKNHMKKENGKTT